LFRIDYKQQQYALFLGRSFDSVDNTIALRPDFESGYGRKDGSTQPYFSIEEDLVTVGNQQGINKKALPSLFLKFKNNRLQSFHAVLVIEHKSRSASDWNELMNHLEAYFSSLKSATNRSKLWLNGKLDLGDKYREEVFRFDTTTSTPGMLFEYNTSYRKPA